MGNSISKKLHQRLESISASPRSPTEIISASTVNSEQPSPSKDTSNMQAQKDLAHAEEELLCSICTEMFVKAVTLSCSHTFCNYCITQWQKNQAVCPLCKTKITMQFPTLVVNNFVDKIIEGASEEVKQHRRKLIAEREATEAPLTSSDSTFSTLHPNARSAQEPLESVSLEDANSDEDYNGLPGSSYGGYGHCFSCGQRGHWANGCPNRRTVSSDEEDDTNDTDENNSGSDQEDDDDNNEHGDYNGLPGYYYGGYGHCYSCGQRGHWANGCPNRTVSSDDEGDTNDTDGSDNNDSGSDQEQDDDSDNEDYNGLPGYYYGGYGSCHSCGQRGHWANGCPNTNVSSDENDDDYSESDQEHDDDNDNEHEDYNGLPGYYYGGYGYCHSCGKRGHWANGCPNRRAVSSNEDDDDYSGSDQEHDDDNDNGHKDYNGLPGCYYGGYGHCHSCGKRGHWANGCPNRGKR